MLFDQFPNTVPEQYQEAAREWLNNEFNQSILTGAEVCKYCKISQPTLSKLVAKENPFFVFKKGNTLLFIAHYAKPWMDNIVATHIAKASTREAKKVKQPRVKKADNEFSYELMGHTYTDTRKPAIVHQEWLVKLAQDFPQYYADPATARILPEVMTNREAYPEYYSLVLPIRTAINEAFKQFKGTGI